MDKRTKSENLKYIDQKLPFVENLKNYTNILWLVQFHWRTLYWGFLCLPKKVVHINPTLAQLAYLQYIGTNYQLAP